MLNYPVSLVFGKKTTCVDSIFPLEETETPLKECFIGVEVEVEGIRHDPYMSILPYWQSKEDGSLRNHGREYVSLPIQSKYIRSALALLKEKLEQKNIPDFSRRTSIHVHLNVQDMSLHELITLILVYYSVEKLLYRFVGRERSKNIFCVPLQDTDYFETIYDATRVNNKEDASLNDLSHFKDLFQGWRKYTGLNLLPLFQYGTIEFRHMHGTLDLDYLTGWINMLLGMKKYAQQAKDFDATVQTLINLNVGSNYMAFLRDVFGEEAPLLMEPGFEEIFSSSISGLKECVSPPTSFLHVLENYRIVDNPLLSPFIVSPRKQKLEVTKDTVINWGEIEQAPHMNFNDIVAARDVLNAAPGLNQIRQFRLP